MHTVCYITKRVDSSSCLQCEMLYQLKTLASVFSFRSDLRPHCTLHCLFRKKEAQSKRTINLGDISSNAKLLPDPVRDLLSRFYGVTINQTQHSMNNPNISTTHSAADHFIEISGSSDVDLLDNAANYIRHCIQNSFVHRLQRYNVPSSVLNHIAFQSGCFLCKLANFKYFVVPNIENGDGAMTKMDAATNHIHCKRIAIGSLSGKDVDIIFNAFQSIIDRWKWEYSFSIWIDRVDADRDGLQSVRIGYFDAVRLPQRVQSRESDLVQLHDEITQFLTGNLFEVVKVSTVEGLEGKWNQFWSEIKDESELVTMTLYDDRFAVFKTKREFGAMSIMKCKQWLQDEEGSVMEDDGERDGVDGDDGMEEEHIFYEIDGDEVIEFADDELPDEEDEVVSPDPDENLFTESRASTLLMDMLTNQDRKIAEQIEAEHGDGEGVESDKMKYNLKLMKECTSPLLTEKEFYALGKRQE